eukprot:g31728.t1
MVRGALSIVAPWSGGSPGLWDFAGEFHGQAPQPKALVPKVQDDAVAASEPSGSSQDMLIEVSRLELGISVFALQNLQNGAVEWLQSKFPCEVEKPRMGGCNSTGCGCEKGPPPTFSIDPGSAYSARDRPGSDKTPGGQTLSGGATYEGQWRGEDKHGEGKLIFADGSKYEGQFENHTRYTYSNGSTYEGQWKMEVQDGHGVEKLVDGSVFEGQFKNGDKSGKGKFTWNTGGSYEGDFDANDMHGEGRYQWSDGRSYTGHCVRNHMGPFGTMKWTDGRCYEGQFRDGKKHGEGKLSWPDGRSYTGQWDSGRQHGVGIAVTAKGLSRKSQWEHDMAGSSSEELLRAQLLEAQQSEAEAREQLQKSAELGQVLLSRNEYLEQELEALRQEQAAICEDQSRALAAEASHRDRLEEECKRLETDCSVDSDEEPSLVQMQQRLKRCEKSEQEHREAACLAEDHASMLEEKNQKLEEEGCWRGLSWFILKRMFLTHRARCWASG